MSVIPNSSLRPESSVMVGNEGGLEESVAWLPGITTTGHGFLSRYDVVAPGTFRMRPLLRNVIRHWSSGFAGARPQE